MKLDAEGPAAAHILAFARRDRKHIAVTAITRLSAGLVGDIPLVPPRDWAGTSLRLPGFDWLDALNGGMRTGRVIQAATLFADLPVALLRSP